MSPQREAKGDYSPCSRQWRGNVDCPDSRRKRLLRPEVLRVRSRDLRRHRDSTATLKVPFQAQAPLPNPPSFTHAPAFSHQLQIQVPRDRISVHAICRAFCAVLAILVIIAVQRKSSMLDSQKVGLERQGGRGDSNGVSVNKVKKGTSRLRCRSCRRAEARGVVH
jgi:hypothetical protein